MPRSTLPSMLKNLETQDVLLTKNTSEDVWESIKLKYDLFEVRKNYFLKKASEYCGMFLDTNVYINCDINKPLDRIHQDKPLAWIPENEHDEYYSIFKLRHDLEICKKTMNYDFQNMIDDLNIFQMRIQMHIADIKTLEENYYNIFHMKRRNLAEAKLEQDIKSNPHKYHTSINDWNKLFREHPDAWTWHNGSEQVKYKESLECPKCIEIEEQRIQITTIYEEIKEVVHELKREKQVIVDYNCADCNFKTQYKEIFTAHNFSIDHRHILKLKEWFCVKCNSQSRTQTEWNNHIQTNKHLNKSDNKEYTCEKCNYKTLLKHHYTQHCETKKHCDSIKDEVIPIVVG